MGTDAHDIGLARECEHARSLTLVGTGRRHRFRCPSLALLHTPRIICET
jgi:hypothetical protein